MYKIDVRLYGTECGQIFERDSYSNWSMRRKTLFQSELCSIFLGAFSMRVHFNLYILYGKNWRIACGKCKEQPAAVLHRLCTLIVFIFDSSATHNSVNIIFTRCSFGKYVFTQCGFSAFFFSTCKTISLCNKTHPACADDKVWPTSVLINDKVVVDIYRKVHTMFVFFPIYHTIRIRFFCFVNHWLNYFFRQATKNYVNTIFFLELSLHFKNFHNFISNLIFYCEYFFPLEIFSIFIFFFLLHAKFKFNGKTKIRECKFLAKHLYLCCRPINE